MWYEDEAASTDQKWPDGTKKGDFVPGRKGGRPDGNKKGDFVPGKVGDPSQEQIPCSFPELPEKTGEKVKCGRSTAY